MDNRGTTLKRMLPVSACLKGHSEISGPRGVHPFVGWSLILELSHRSLSASFSFVSSSCAVLCPRDAEDEPLRPGHHYSQGAAGGEPQPPVERPRRSGGVVRFVLDKS